jgi:hypothetical protein
MNFIDDKIERAEIAVVEVFAQFELFFFVFFFFFLTPTNSQTNSRDYCMPISTASAIWRGRACAQSCPAQAPIQPTQFVSLHSVIARRPRAPDLPRAKDSSVCFFRFCAHGFYRLLIYD